MIKPDSILHYQPPAFKSRKEDKTLLVWDEPAQWMVVDNDFIKLTELIDGKTKTSDIINRIHPAFSVNTEDIAKIYRVLSYLKEKGVVYLKTSGRKKVQMNSDRIFNITFNITNKCNLKCPFCYNLGRKTDEIDISSIISRLKEFRPFMAEDASLIILGGEPFINKKRLFTLLEKAGNIFSTPVMISTNGTFIDDDIATELKKHNVEIQVSIDSHKQEIHDKYRGEGVFSKAVEAVKNLKKAGVYTILSMVFSSENYEQIADYLKMAKDLNADEARFIPLRFIGNGISETTHIPDNYVVFRHLLKILGQQPAYVKLLKRDYFSILGSVCRFNSNRINCGIGRKVLMIDSDGSVYPCPNNTGNIFNAGNIKNSSISRIFNKSKVFNKIRKAYHIEKYPSCRKCFIRYWCAGDCKGEVFSLNNGNIRAGSPHCSEIKKTFIEMLWLISEQKHPFAKNINDINSLNRMMI